MSNYRTYTNNNGLLNDINRGEEIRSIILHHNKVIDTLYALNFKITENQILTGMNLWNNLALEGSYIVTLARANGINVKVNMQDGKITYQNFSTLYEVHFIDGTNMLIRSGDDKLDIKTAEAYLREEIVNYGKIVDVIPIAITEAAKIYNTNGHATWPLIG